MILTFKLDVESIKLNQCATTLLVKLLLRFLRCCFYLLFYTCIHSLYSSYYVPLHMYYRLRCGMSPAIKVIFDLL